MAIFENLFGGLLRAYPFVRAALGSSRSGNIDFAEVDLRAQGTKAPRTDSRDKVTPPPVFRAPTQRRTFDEAAGRRRGGGPGFQPAWWNTFPVGSCEQRYGGTNPCSTAEWEICAEQADQADLDWFEECGPMPERYPIESDAPVQVAGLFALGAPGGGVPGDVFVPPPPPVLVPAIGEILRRVLPILIPPLLPTIEPEPELQPAPKGPPRRFPRRPPEIPLEEFPFEIPPRIEPPKHVPGPKVPEPDRPPRPRPGPVEDPEPILQPIPVPRRMPLPQRPAIPSGRPAPTRVPRPVPAPRARPPLPWWLPYLPLAVPFLQPLVTPATVPFPGLIPQPVRPGQRPKPIRPGEPPVIPSPIRPPVGAPLTPFNPVPVPFTQPFPQRLESPDDTCVCEKKPRKPRKARTECREGTYRETSRGTLKRPRRKIQCR